MRRINHCLNHQLIDICKQVVQLEKLNQTVSHFLPSTLQEHCQVGSFHKGCLVLVIDNAVWATQLRYHLPELRDKLRQDAGIYQLTSIKIHIAVEKSVTPTLKKRGAQPISAIACEEIIAKANECAYPPLKEALYHLAQPKAQK